MAERQGAIVVSFGSNRAGVAPSTVMEVLARALAYCDALAKECRVASFRTYASTSRIGGQLLIEGALSTLAAISVEPESLKLLAQAGAVVDDLRVELMWGGSPDDVTGYYLEAVLAMQEAGLA